MSIFVILICSWSLTSF